MANKRIASIVLLALLGSILVAACGPGAQPTPAPAAAPTKAAEAPKPAPAAATPTPAPAKPTSAAPTPTPRPVSLKFGSDGTLNQAGVYVGIEKGFFKEEGIDLELVAFRSIAELIPPLGTGQVDAIGMPISAAVLAAADRGIQMKVVADGGQNIPNWAPGWLVLRKDLVDSGRVKTPADLKGLKVAIPSPQGFAQMSVELILADGLLKPSDVEMVTLPFAEQAAALANKAIDAAFTAEPYIARGVQDGASVKWIPAHKMFQGRVQTVLMIFGAQLAKDKDLAQRWMVAYLKGVRVYLDAFEKKAGRDEVIGILARHTPVKDTKLYDLMEVPYLDPNGLIDKKSMDAQFKWFVDKGVYQGKKTFDDIMDLSFAEAASQKLGKR